MGHRFKTYALHGLNIRSEIPLDEDESPAASPDLDVRRGPAGPLAAAKGRLIAEFTLFGRTWYRAYEHGDDYLLRFPKLADFVVSADLRQVQTRPESETDEEAISLLLVGTTVAFVLALRGHCVLHAGAVAIDGRAVALAGLAGTGKSTCTALLCAQGAALVADDVLRVELGDVPTAIRGASSIRLRPRAASLIELFAETPPSRHTYDQRLAIYPPRGELTLPLAAVVLPRPNREIDQVQLVQIAGAEALTSLISSARFTGWSNHDRQRRQFEQLANLARSIPVYRAQVPWREPMSASVGEELLDVLAREITR